MGGTIHEQEEAPEWSRGVKRQLPERSTPRGVAGRHPPRRASLTVEAMPPIKANPSVEEIVAWYRNLADQSVGLTTKDMDNLAGANGGHLDGVEFRIKGDSSLRSARSRTA